MAIVKNGGTILLMILLLAVTSAAGEKGKLYVVVAGPAGSDLMAPRAQAAIKAADVCLTSPGLLNMEIRQSMEADHTSKASFLPREHTKENAKSIGLDNINCILGCWEDVDTVADLWGLYDVVIASLSLI